MREILFRGKRLDDGEWVEGSLVHRTSFYGNPVDQYCIVHCGEFHFDYYDADEVDPETVCEFTGLYDPNGVKIFEGDIIKTRKEITVAEELQGYHGYDKDGYPKKIPGYTGSMTVYRNTFDYDYHGVVLRDRRGQYYISGTTFFIDAICNEVVGNIFDNPELLKEEV